MPAYLENLNEEQYDAVTHTEGYVRVVAGAGSGKTKALTSRYSFLVDPADGYGIDPASILCVTFTNKAANEMKSRIRRMLGDMDLGLICTFHSFAVQILRRNPEKIHYPQNFIILDNEDKKSILRTVFEEREISSKDLKFKEAENMVSVYKTVEYNEYIDLISAESDEKLKKLYLESERNEDKVCYGYLYEQKKNAALDFDDLIYLALYELEKFEDVRTYWQNRISYVMVDEFQDVSKPQYDMAEIVSAKSKNLFVVGDPDQTIYTWRGAKTKFLVNFDKEHANTHDVIMNKNYRSAPSIIYASNSLISKNTDRIKKELVPTVSDKTVVVYNHTKDKNKEAKWIAGEISRLHKAGLPYSDIAILYRAHYISRPIEEALLGRKIPYTIYSGFSFYERKEVKDILSYLRMLVSQDDISFKRTVNEPRRGFGIKKMDIIKDYARTNSCSLYDALIECAKVNSAIASCTQDYIELIEKYRPVADKMKLTEIVKCIMIESGYEEMMRSSGDDERLDNISELLQSISDYEQAAGEFVNLPDYLAHVTLYTNMDADSENADDKVKMMTIHTAKGLEFPAVFVCALNEGIFPGMKTTSKEKLEEERRLAYVAFTRSKKFLFLSDAEGMNYDGNFRYPSRFIFNIDKQLLHYKVELDQRLVMEAERYIRAEEKEAGCSSGDGTEVAAGNVIKHRFFGEGKIVEVNENAGSCTAEFSDGKMRSFPLATAVSMMVKE